MTHSQLEAVLTAARQATNDYDSALVVMPGLLGLQIFEATGAEIDDLGEERGPDAPISDTETFHVPLGPTLGTGRQAQPGRASSSDPECAVDVRTFWLLTAVSLGWWQR